MRFLVLLLITSQCFSQDPVVYVEKDNPAPFTGYLFTPEKEKDVRLKIIDLNYEKSIAEAKDKQIELYKINQSVYDERIKNYQAQNIALADQLGKASSMSTLEHILWFGLGCVVTTGLVYGVKKAVN